jgi:hypothetical protein
MSNQDTAATLEYHEATKHSEQSVRTSRHFLDFENQPLSFKIYRDLEAIPLPQSFPENDLPALEVISPCGAAPAANGHDERTPDLATLARVLYLSAGITKRKRHAGGEALFRAYPNTGALHHIDLYVVAGELPGLSAGVYHFGPHDFALCRLREGDYRAVLVEAGRVPTWRARRSSSRAPRPTGATPGSTRREPTGIASGTAARCMRTCSQWQGRRSSSRGW